MKKITFTLKLGTKGRPVADLQDALQLLIERSSLLPDDEARGSMSARLKLERAQQSYEKATTELVSAFQKERGFQSSGDVDKRTADALNELLQDWGVLPTPVEIDIAYLDSRYTVFCRAEDARAKPIEGLRIEAFDQDPNSPHDPLGEPATTGVDGVAVFRFKRSDFAEHPDEKGPDLYFKIYRGEVLLDHAVVGIRSDDGVIRGFKQQREPIVLRIDKHFVVTGVIVQANGLRADELRLSVQQTAFNGKVSEVGKPVTDSQGRFALAYDPGATAVNLDISVKDPRSAEKTVPLIKTRFNAAPFEVLNLITPDKPLASEYERLSGDLRPHVGRLQDLAKAREDAERRDLSVLNRATGWDARLIALRAITERLSLDPEVTLSPEAVYGLLRAGLPSDKLLLAQIDPNDAAETLKIVRTAGIIALSDSQIQTFKKNFDIFRTNVRLNTTTPGSRSTYREFLKNSGLSRPAWEKFASVYFNHRGDAGQLWEAAAAHLKPAEIRRLQLQGKLAFVSSNNVALTTRLLRRRINDPAELVEQNFHRADSWTREIFALAGVPINQRANLTEAQRDSLNKQIPSAYTGEEVEDRVRAYAEDMARKVRVSYPSQVVAHRLETDEKFKLPAAHNATVALLRSAASQGFRLGTTSAPKFFKTHTGVGDPNDPDFHTAQRQIETLHRLYRVTSNEEAMAVLMRMQITSAYDLVAYSENEFIAAFNATYVLAFMGPPRNGLAEKIFRKAQQVDSTTTNVFAIAKHLEREQQPAVLSTPVEVRESVRNELIKQYPNLETLFGSMDFCECQHCRSVLSPAAYLVDLFQFLDPDDERWARTPKKPNAVKPYEVLTTRRPDLSHIQLTCENTLTAMPYIDIANEILEYYVANKGLAGAAAQNTGNVTTAELLAEPQNVISGAYGVLRDARYPLNLPFDLPIEIVRQFCDYFETPLGRVLEIFRQSNALFAPGQSVDHAGIFLERLGLSPGETALFTDASPLTEWHKLYGYANLNEATDRAEDPVTKLRTDLNSAKVLARRLGVTYRELAEIVDTEFVNPELHQSGLRRKLEMSIEETQFFLQNLHLLQLDRLSLPPEQRKTLMELDVYDARLQKWAAKYSVPYDDLITELSATPFDKILHLDYRTAGCDFDKTILRYADGTDAADNPAKDLDFLRINLFVRLWRKLGWSIAETDRALSTFIPKDARFEPAKFARKPLQTALIYLSHLKTLDDKLRLGKQSRLKLLTLWSDLPTTGKDPLYEKLFLVASVLRSDFAFDEAFGNYLSASLPIVSVAPAAQQDHRSALQGALGLTADEIRAILDDAGDPIDQARLTLENVSRLYRYGLLANALKLSVAELITLKRLSGLDPFKKLDSEPLNDKPANRALEFDYPFTQTLRFVEVAEAVAASGLKIEDLDYLLCHRFDETGKYRPNREAILKLLKTIGDGVRAIRAEHAVPEVGSMTEEVLKQKLSLALAPDAVTTFLGMLNATAEFTATKRSTNKFDDPKKLEGDPQVGQASYDDTILQLRLTFRGVLVPAQKAPLETKFSSRLTAAEMIDFSEAIDNVLVQVREFFDNNLRRRTLNPNRTTGFLDAGDFPRLFRPLKELRVIDPNATPQAIADTKAENEKTVKENQQELQARRDHVASAFLPFLQQRLIRELVIQNLTAYTEAESTLVEGLLTDKALLKFHGSQVLTTVARAERSGLVARFFASSDGSGAALRGALLPDANTGLKNSAGDPVRPNAANSARLEGYLEVPAPGAYRFYAVLDKIGAQATFKLAHLPQATMSGAAAVANAEIGHGLDEYVELLPGMLYQYSLELNTLGGGEARLLVQGEALPKGPLSQLRLYPLNVITDAERAIVLLTKALQLVQSLGLSEREIRYLSINSAAFGGFRLRRLPTEPVAQPSMAAATRRFNQFLRLATYTRLKRDMAGGTDDLIAVFEAQKAGGAPQVYPLLAKLTRREQAIVGETSAVLFVAPAFKSEKPLQRLWQALQVVERFGVPVASLVKWTQVVNRNAVTPPPSPLLPISPFFEIGRDVRETIKARFEPDVWLRVAQPIFDRLRRRQRDALTSYIIHEQKFERLEQLYEYFLIDPGMEPVVQTSRIRLAIASVQLFIQRCLLNMEEDVQPSLINSPHWEWMKRYRVWEANRKIFLFPENWLEPEFRDDKTHLFAELEGALLQGDVSSDLVEDAFLNYLRKLDELARLDIVGLHIEDDAGPNRRTLHVFGRTYSQPHKYFYRRFRGSWTPWEPVSAEIEGDHLAPVVWRDRLFLFWVTFLEKAEQSITGSIDPRNVIPIPLPKTTVEVQLHWSEYLNGEWNTRESSGLNPATMVKTGLPSFDSKKALIHVSKNKINEGQDNEEDDGLYIHVGDPINQAFFLAGRNSTPESAIYATAGALPTNRYNRDVPYANRYSAFTRSNLSVTIVTETESNPPPTKILEQPNHYRLTLCDNNLTVRTESGDLVAPEIVTLVKPFFCQDNTNTFFVEPTLTEREIDEQGYIEHPPERNQGLNVRDLTQDPKLQAGIRELLVPGVKPGVEPFPPRPVDDGRGGLINPPRNQDLVTNPFTVLEFNNALIGRSGFAGISILAAGTPTGGRTPVHVNSGSGSVAGATVVVDDVESFSASGLVQVAGGFNVIGSLGFNFVMAQNFDAASSSGFVERNTEPGALEG